MPTLAHIWRHPIKSHGREAVERVALVAGQAMPFDRHWAIAHEAAKIGETPEAWHGCVNFIRAAISPAHCAITAEFDAPTGKLVLRHPKHGATPPLDPDVDNEAPLEFSRLVAGDLGRRPTRVVKSPSRGFTDTDYPSVSLLNMSSLAALEGVVGAPLGTERWRGNLWIDGLAPWAEFDMVGARVKIRAVTLEISEPIVRCRATETDAHNGVYDFETRRILRTQFGHENFGVYARVIDDGDIALGDEFRVLA